MTKRLLIVEDDPEIVSALMRGLLLHGYDTESENRATNALARLQSETFSGAIVDVMLGQDSGIELVRQARDAGATLPILMLSALSDVEHRTDGLDAGADDYIVKPFSFDELVARLRVQERLAVARTPSTLSSNEKSLSNTTESVHLTDREFELLSLLIRHGKDPVTRGTLFDTLWASEGSANENVVDVYIGYLRKKLKSAAFGFEIITLRNKGFQLNGTIPHIR